MKKISWHKHLLFAATLALGMTSPAWASDLGVSTNSVDFGSFNEGPVASKEVTLTNNGKETLVIKNVTSNWSCTTTALGQRSLAPGESTTMFINYNSYKFPGLFDKLITVYTGPDGKDKDIIHVIGNVTPIHMPAVEVNPRKVVLENLVAGQESTHTVMISNIGDAPMMVSKLTSNKTKKDYWKGQRIVPAGKSVGFDITVTPKEAGNFTDFLMIYSDARNDFGKGYKAVLTGTAQ